MLTEVFIKNAPPKSKAYRVFDSDRLYLCVLPTGRKYWHYRYYYDGKEKKISFGAYPKISIKEARRLRDDAALKLRNGINPALERRARSRADADSFAAIAYEWLEKRKPKWTPYYYDQVKNRIESNLIPYIGAAALPAITTPVLLGVLRKIEDRGALDMARRVRSLCAEIFKYAIITARADHNPAADLEGALSARKTKHFPTITDPEKIGRLARDIWGYHGGYKTRAALKLIAYTFVRTKELRHAKWADIDLDAGEWRIGASDMKKNDQPFIVPLSRQAVAAFLEIKPLTGMTEYVFPADKAPRIDKKRNTAPVVGETIILNAIRRLGYDSEEMCGHGFRAMASTRLNELGFNFDAIERQLSHVDKNKTRRAYNHAQYLDERRVMLQFWADYLDALRTGGTLPARAA